MSLVFPGGSRESNPVFLMLAVAVISKQRPFVALKQTGVQSRSPEGVLARATSGSLNSIPRVSHKIPTNLDPRN